MKSNNGGRNKFPKGQPVRYLTLQGSVSSEECVVDPNNPNDVIVADRKGLVLLATQDGKKEFRIQSRRILPVSIGGSVPVIESGNKYRAVCNKCQNVLDITGTTDQLDCSNCQTTLSLFWIGDKPVKNSATAQMVDKVPQTKSKTPKQAKKMTQPHNSSEHLSAKVDLAALASMAHIELWTKKSVKFDHVNVDVRAHALIFTGDNPRKLCFNTYDGALGKKAPELPIDDFIHDREVQGARRPWFEVKDLDKARAQLKKNGYEQA